MPSNLKVSGIDKIWLKNYPDGGRLNSMRNQPGIAVGVELLELPHSEPIGHAFSIAPSHTLEEIRSRILGPAGTAVLMTFRRPGGRFGTAPRSEEFTYEVELVRRKPGAAVEGVPAQADDAYSEVLRLREELRTLQERRHVSPRIDIDVRIDIERASPTSVCML